MSYSYAVRREIYLSWKPIFSLGNNAQLRKRAKIVDVVGKYAARSHRFWHPNLVSILKSLLEEGVFSSEFIARSKFPDVYEADKEVDSVPVESAHIRKASEPSEFTEPMDELKSSLRELYRGRQYSDFTIVCRESRYQVHKAIVCPRSDFFARACEPGFKEEREGKIHLSDDNPIAVACMVYYFYHLDYTPLDIDNPDIALIDEKQEPLANDDFKTFTETTSSIWTNAGLVTHAQVYALAEKYHVKGLKSLALQKFRDSVERVHDEDWTEHFLAAVEEAFTSTVETDRELRNLVLQTFHQHPELLDEDRTQDLLKRLSSLTFDLLMYGRRRNASGCW